MGTPDVLSISFCRCALYQEKGHCPSPVEMRPKNGEVGSHLSATHMSRR